MELYRKNFIGVNWRLGQRNINNIKLIKWNQIDECSYQIMKSCSSDTPDICQNHHNRLLCKKN